jgi:hypothetical protein
MYIHPSQRRAEDPRIITACCTRTVRTAVEQPPQQAQKKKKTHDRKLWFQCSAKNGVQGRKRRFHFGLSGGSIPADLATAATTITVPPRLVTPVYMYRCHKPTAARNDG